MQSVEKTVTEGRKVPGTLSDGVVHLLRGRSQGKQNFRFQTPFQSWRPPYLIFQRLAGDQVRTANANQRKNVGAKRRHECRRGTQKCARHATADWL